MTGEAVADPLDDVVVANIIAEKKYKNITERATRFCSAACVMKNKCVNRIVLRWMCELYRGKD